MIIKKKKNILLFQLVPVITPWYINVFNCVQLFCLTALNERIFQLSIIVLGYHSFAVCCCTFLMIFQYDELWKFSFQIRISQITFPWEQNSFTHFNTCISLLVAWLLCWIFNFICVRVSYACWRETGNKHFQFLFIQHELFYESTRFFVSISLKIFKKLFY